MAARYRGSVGHVSGESNLKVERTGHQRRAIICGSAGPPLTKTLCCFSVAMSKSRSALLGALSFVPALGLCLILALVSYLPLEFYQSNPQLLWLIGLAYVVGSWLIVIGAMVLALRSYHIHQGQRILWVLALFVFNMFVLPVFWYKCVWRPTGEPAT